ncbi:hypothetical protein AGABI1DRAFT_130531 [Agaricus bisporus var. burnettii JB137-S8]|uniref:Uncharacterized protein n=2 Tax=Agaricus bisporus var. burnettii TaxID=192524 RepID=K5WQ15_AGABU|nr:uncharacterized protein AGABI1DRAFT_130531 [Agaricus bisporus var. burnettii JB137-S8]EKM77451.1 hypothetical protein AGABI1DRAFT_130531 [Agaricus bisporus var. burnettii JB137-S8]KAF7763650.1 hypothetical protein Agabi119p4_8187 [Agaricus bisporus var. burnettii]
MSDSDVSTKSPIGSPPLILACLAIGIFSAALISVFGWRRVRFTNDGGRRGILGRPELDPWSNLKERPGIGEKPIMWEVWTDRNAKINNMGYGCWRLVMPLALHCSPPEPSNHESATEVNLPSLPTASLPTTARRRPFRGFTVRSLLPLHRRTVTLDPLLPVEAAEYKEEEVSGMAEAAEKKQTQVAIIIEMPSLASSRRRHDHPFLGSPEHQKHQSYYSALSKSETLVEAHDKVKDDCLESGFEEGEHEYCIGVHICPWTISTKLKEDKEASRTMENR